MLHFASLVHLLLSEQTEESFTVTSRSRHVIQCPKLLQKPLKQHLLYTYTHGITTCFSAYFFFTYINYFVLFRTKNKPQFLNYLKKICLMRDSSSSPKMFLIIEFLLDFILIMYKNVHI